MRPRGDEVRAWARYWSQVYRYVLNELAADEALREASLIVRFEDLCRESSTRLSALLDHCRFAQPGEVLTEPSGRVRPSPGSQAMFTAQEMAVIREETEEVAGRLGY